VLDPDIAVEQDELHASLSGLSTQKISRALQQLSYIKVFGGTKLIIEHALPWHRQRRQ
jgi:hypothetical protein